MALLCPSHSGTHIELDSPNPKLNINRVVAYQVITYAGLFTANGEEKSLLEHSSTALF